MIVALVRGDVLGLNPLSSILQVICVDICINLCTIHSITIAGTIQVFMVVTQPPHYLPLMGVRSECENEFVAG